MGMFDSVMIDCPHCGAKVELQCDGDENMAVYSVDTAPDRILREVVNGEPCHCMKCNGWLALVDARHPWKQPERPSTNVVKVKPPERPSTHPQGMQWWPGDEPYGPDLIIT